MPDHNNSSHIRVARHAVENLIVDGLIKFSEEIVYNPVVCVIKWFKSPFNNDETYNYAVFDLGMGDEARPLVQSHNTDLQEILGVAEDYKAFVIYVNKPFTREIDRLTRPAVLLDTAKSV